MQTSENIEGRALCLSLHVVRNFHYISFVVQKGRLIPAEYMDSVYTLRDSLHVDRQAVVSCLCKWKLGTVACHSEQDLTVPKRRAVPSISGCRDTIFPVRPIAIMQTPEWSTIRPLLSQIERRSSCN